MDTETQSNTHELDGRYVPFPCFDVWKQLKVEDDRWRSCVASLETHGSREPEILRKAREVAKRAAAIDTGAIEGLYELEAGFTITVASQVAMWQAAFQKKAEETRKMIEAQMAGYDEVIDLATKGAPMAEAWLRGLHQAMCAAQETYVVHTTEGEQRQKLPLGKYKEYPNHVQQADGTIFTYAPVLRTGEEMRRLVGELASDSFLAAHPVIQSAFAHYALVRIHPFADGNGRTARALASVYTYRSGSIPFMVLMENKQDYLASLRKADAGELQAFVDFSFRRALDAFSLVEESLRAARLPSASEAVANAKRLHITRAGYTHRQIDEAGEGLLQALFAKAKEYGDIHRAPNQLDINVTRWANQFPASPSKSHRPPRSFQSQFVMVRLDSPAPAQAQQNAAFCYYVPFDAAPDDSVIVRCSDLNLSAEFRIDELIPKQTTVMLLRLSMFFERAFAAAIVELSKKSKATLAQNGYA